MISSVLSDECELVSLYPPLCFVGRRRARAVQSDKLLWPPITRQTDAKVLPNERSGLEEIEVNGRADHRDLARKGAGAKTAEVFRRHWVSDAKLYAWKAKFGGMEPSEAKCLKSLEDENAKLKRPLADAMLDNTALKDLLSEFW